MSTATVKRSRFKDWARNTGGKVKNYAGRVYQNSKNGAKMYKSELRTAYDIGYSQGWDDAGQIPRCFGGRTAAAWGYRKGIKQRLKHDKYNNQYRRKRQ